MFIFLLISCQTSQKVDSSQPETNNIADCSEELPSLDWTENSIPSEGITGIEEELSALDFSQLDDPIDISTMLPMYRGLIAYALEIRPSDLSSSLTHETIQNTGVLGDVVLGALLLGKEDVTGFDITFFRRGLHRYYTCSRGFPLTIEEFQNVYGVYESNSGTTVDSIAKCGNRRLISEHSGVYIAESITEGTVRETEILLENQRTDGQLEFLVYDEQGRLTNKTQFPTLDNGPHIVTSSPYACMTCHLNSDSDDDTWGYDLLMPTTGPCR
jgi:hypothetical protein